MKKYINPKKLFHGAFIPNWLLRRRDLGFGAKLVYARLCQYAGDNALCYPSQETLGEELGTNKRQIIRFLAELEKNNLIERVRVGLKCTNRYIFPYHPWMEEHIIDRPCGDNLSLLEVTNPALLEVTNCHFHSNRIRSNRIRSNKYVESLKTFDDALKLSRLLYSEILINETSTRLPHITDIKEIEKIINTWAKDIDKLIRIDHQDPSIVEEVIRWTQQDGFWGPNVLSGRKLREKWDVLVAQKKQRVSNSRQAKSMQNKTKEDELYARRLALMADVNIGRAKT